MAGTSGLEGVSGSGVSGSMNGSDGDNMSGGFGLCENGSDGDCNKSSGIGGKAAAAYQSDIAVARYGVPSDTDHCEKLCWTLGFGQPELKPTQHPCRRTGTTGLHSGCGGASGVGRAGDGAILRGANDARHA